MADWHGRWREVADGVLVRRHRVMDVNVTLVLGDDRCLLVDTHTHAGHGLDVLRAVRDVTAAPMTVVITHAHADHCFGTAAIVDAEPGTPVWGHAGCRAELLASGALQRKTTAAWLAEGDGSGDAEQVLAVRIHPPEHTFTDSRRLDLGGRSVLLAHPGRGHTGHDVVVHVEGASVTVAGDLVEEGAPPAFEDAYPQEWPATLAALLPTLGAVVVPGHGDVVDRGFVEAQAADLAVVAAVAAGLPDDVDDRALLAEAVRLPVGRHAGLVALRRGIDLRRNA